MIITSFDQLDLTKQYTYADYLSWKFEERVEIIKGWVMRMAAPSIPHQTVLFQLTLQMGYSFENHACRLLFAPTDVCFVRKNEKNKDIKTVVQPDLLVVCDLEKIKNGKNVMGAPDWVVEILSTGNTTKEMKQKYELYQEEGVKEYWLIHPSEKYAVVHTINADRKYIASPYFTEEDTLYSVLFPELEIDLKKVFKNV